MSHSSTKRAHEFTCPYCTETNSLQGAQAYVLNIEQRITCPHCSQEIDVIVAKGIEDRLNVIICSAPEPEKETESKTAHFV